MSYLLEQPMQADTPNHTKNITIEQTGTTRYCSYTNSTIPPYAHAIHLQSHRHNLPSIWISLQAYNAVLTELQQIEKCLSSQGWASKAQHQDLSGFVSSHLVSNGSVHCAFCEQDLEKNSRAVLLNSCPTNDCRFGPSLWYHYTCFSEVVSTLEYMYQDNSTEIVTTLI